MTERWLGVVVSSDNVTIIDAEIPSTGPVVLQADHSWPLQRGARAAAYRIMHQHVADYAREQGIKRAIIKGSAVSLGGTKKVHLEAAELRGVIMCALASVTTVEMQARAHISKSFGERKVEEYLKDDTFWGAEFTGRNLRVGSREAAMMVLASRKK